MSDRNSRLITVKTAGAVDDAQVWIDPHRAECGTIEEGLAFGIGNGGAIIVAFEDLSAAIDRWRACRVEELISKGAILATDEDDDDAQAFNLVIPDSNERARREGWRFHLYRAAGEGNATLAEEQVLPEKVDDPHANRVKASSRIHINLNDARNLRDGLDKLIAAMEAES